MPRTQVLFYREDDGAVPVRDWLLHLREHDRRAFAKCAARIGRLGELGYALRRPEADFLAEVIDELRIRLGHVNYRMLYFFHGRNVAILAHALTKEDNVPQADMDRAMRRKAAFEAEPAAHSYEEDIPDA